VKKLFAVLKIVMANPINQKSRGLALVRFFKWQFGSLLVPGKVLIPWINGSRIFSGFMMSGSAGCAYSGLQEFEEMAFVLHFLRKEDLFMDVGANVGVFTVLAGGAVGSACISVEPGEKAYSDLQDNITINRMDSRVRSVQACVSDENSVCRFSNSPESTLSHIEPSSSGENTTEVVTQQIDTLLEGEVPAMLKIDVEGFEKQALRGAVKTLHSEGLKAVLLEIGSHSLRYHVQPAEIHDLMLGHGFNPYAYNPFKREISPIESYADGDNTLYIRDAEFVRGRLKSAPSLVVFGVEI
jgi:FkbM family methyltransferase